MYNKALTGVTRSACLDCEHYRYEMDTDVTGYPIATHRMCEELEDNFDTLGGCFRFHGVEGPRMYVRSGDGEVWYAYGMPWVEQALAMDDIRFKTADEARAWWEANYG